MTTAQSRIRRVPLRGFTLMELMVALTVGGVAITSIYAVGAATTRQFQQQQQVANTQSAVRDALDRVKRDVTRAGYLSTPNANEADVSTGNLVESCALVAAPEHDPSGTGGGSLAAISQFLDNVTPVPNGLAPPGTGSTNQGNGFTHDEIRLIANYETSDQYPGIRVPTGSNTQILVPQNWYAFKRDFTTWYTATPGYSSAAFRQAFTIGRLVRIMTTTRKKHFARLTGVVDPTLTNPARLTFTPAIPAGCLEDADGGWVAPVSVVRYFVQDNTADLRLPANTGPMSQLVRQEVTPGDKDLAFAGNPANTQAVLDFVVAFNLRFQLNTDLPKGQPDQYLLGGLTSNAAAVNANPELVRAVEINLAARTPFSDPRFQSDWDPTNCANQRCFLVFDPNLNQGAARVRHARALVFLPNVAFEGY